MAGERAETPIADICFVKQGRYLAPGEMQQFRTTATPVPVYGANGILGYTDQVMFTEPVSLVTCRGNGCGLLQRTKGPAWISNNAMACPPKGENDSLYLHYLLFGSDFDDVTTGSAQPQITGGHLNTKRLLLATDPVEQRAIAHVLGTLDDLIELNRETNEILEEMAQALFKSWFVDFDPVRAKLEGRPPAGMDASTAALFPYHFQDSELGQIPKGWEVGTIKDCCKYIQNGGTPRRDETRFWQNGDIPWLTSGEVRQSIVTTPTSFITAEGLAESSAKWVSPLSTVVALYGATAGQVSLVASRLTTNQAVCSLIPKENFAFFNYLWMRQATGELENKAVGSAQQNISKGIVEETSVILPPSPLVGKFEQTVYPLFDTWILNLHESRDLAALRDTLLPKLLSGELSAS